MLAITTNNHRDKRVHHNYNNDQSPSIPIPANEHHHTKLEALQELVSNESKAAVEHMIELIYVAWILQNHNEGKLILNTAWSTGGRPRVLEDTAISSIVQRLSNDVGRTYGRKEVNDLIIDH